MKTDLDFVQDEIAGLHQLAGKREEKPSIKCDKAPKGTRHSWKYLEGVVNLRGGISDGMACQYCRRKEFDVKAVPGTKGRYTREIVERLNRLQYIEQQIKGVVA